MTKVKTVKSAVYHYRIRSTGHSSERFGSCEVCGSHCSEVFHQVETREYTNPITGAQGLTGHECRDGYGHEACLKGKRR